MVRVVRDVKLINKNWYNEAVTDDHVAIETR